MCGSKGGGSPPVPNSASTSFQSTTSPSATAMPLYQDFLTRAQTLSNTPFNPAMQGTAAPLNAQQMQAGGQMFDLGMHLGDFDPAKVQSIMSPFTEQVVGATQNWFNNQNAIQGNDLLSQAIKSGNAFGGDRAGVAEGVLAGQQQLAQAPVIAGLRQAGYTQALDEYNKLKQFGMAGAQSALGWGQQLQAQSQRELDIAQQNAMMASAYPFQTLNWYGSALGGIGPLTGQTAIGFNTPPDQSNLAGTIGAATAGVGALTSALPSGVLGGSSGGSTAAATDQGAGGFQRGGLVQLPSRHLNGGLVYRAYGGGSSDDDTGKDDRRDRDDDVPSRDVPPPPERQAPQQGAQAVHSLFGSGVSPARVVPQPVFPSMGGAATQPQKSGLQQGIEAGTGLIKLAGAAAPLFALSDPKTKTDVQRVGKTDDGEPLYGFRYKGDPKTYPKVVGPMAHPPLRRQSGGGDGEIMSDAMEDPIAPGQQFARDYAGRTTWFNPRNEVGGYTYRDDVGQNWTDYGAQRLREGPHASGLPSTTPGFATPGRGDLGNWFAVRGPDGRTAYAQKTDIGPPGVVDLNAPLASRMYGSPAAIASGTTQVRDLGPNQPPEADGTKWPDPSKGNVIPGQGLPTGQQPGVPEPVPGARLGRERPSVSAGPGADPGTGPVGGYIPALTSPRQTPPATFAQRLATNPLWQFGTALMAKPGIKGREMSALGGAAMSMSEHQLEQRKQDVLDAKPQLKDVGGQMSWVYPDGQMIATGVPSTEAQRLAESRRQHGITEGKPFKVGDDVLEPDPNKPGSYRRFTPPEDPNAPPQAPWPVQAAQPQPQQPQQQPQQPPAPAQSQQQPPAPPARTPGLAGDLGIDQIGVGDAAAPPAAAKPAAPAAPAAPAQQPAASPTLRQTQTASPDVETLTGGPGAPVVSDDQKETAAQVAREGFRFKNPPAHEAQLRNLLTKYGTSPEQFDFNAQRLAKGDTSVLQNLGNSKEAGKLKQAYKNRAADYYTEQGKGPDEANAMVAKYGGMKSGARVLANRLATMETAIANVQGTAPVLLDISAKIPRTQYPRLNDVIIAFKGNTGDENVKRMGAAVETLAQNYANALTRTGVTTDSMREHAHKLLEQGFTHGQMGAVVDQMLIEMSREQATTKSAMDQFLGIKPAESYKPGSVLEGRPEYQKPPPSARKTAPGASAAPKQMTDEDRAALDWANNNPDDPRAQRIKKQWGQ